MPMDQEPKKQIESSTQDKTGTQHVLQAQTQTELKAEHKTAEPTVQTTARQAVPSLIRAVGQHVLDDDQDWSSGVRETIREPMFVLLLLCALAYLLLGNWMEALLLGVFVVLLSLMTVWQSVRTGRALRALRQLQVPLARISTPQGVRTVKADSLRVGDVLVLAAGDRVAADAVLLSGQLSVDESLLTGEAVHVSKYPDVHVLDWTLGIASGQGDSVNRVFAGTFVMNGHAQARITAVENQTRSGELARTVMETTRRPSVLQASSRRLVRGIGWLALALVLLQFALSHLWRGEDLLHALLESLTLGMAALPEEVPVIMTVFMAMGAWRMSKSQVLTRRLSALEVLGSVTCIAIDKTGTLTENRMRLEAAHTADGLHGLAQVSQSLVSSNSSNNSISTTPSDALSCLLRTAQRATPAQSGDPIDVCLQVSRADASTALMQLQMQPDWPVFGIVHARGGGGAWLACKGAPECVFSLCGLTDRQREEWSARLDAMAAKGWRVLAVASGEAGSIETLQDWSAARQVARWKLLGLIAFHDPPRGSVRHAVAALKAAGVRLLMLTGDHPVTAVAIASQVGMTGSHTALTGRQIEELSDEMLTAELRNTNVCARMTAAQKLRVIACLQGDGQVVAMTGDGVNDTPALKAADVGVAMGRRACDLARETADLVLLDDDFSHMVAAVSQGRQIFWKLQRTTAFVVATHIPMLLLVLVPGFMNWPVLLMPAHVVLFEMLINPASSIVFEAQQADRSLMKQAPRPSGSTPFGKKSLVDGLRQGLGLSACMMGAWGFLWLTGQSDVQQRTFLFLLLAVFVMLAGWLTPATDPTGKPGFAWWVMAAVTSLFALMCVAIPALARLLEVAWPNQQVLGALLMAAVAATITLRVLRPLPDGQ